MDPSSSPSAIIQRFAGLAFGALAQTVNTMLVQFEHLLLCPPCRGLGVAIARGLLGFSCIHGLRILLRNMRENTQARDGLAHLPMIMRRCSFPQRSPVEGNREKCSTKIGNVVWEGTWHQQLNASTSTFNPLFHSSWSHSGASMAQGTVSRQSCIKQTFRQNLCAPSRLATFLKVHNTKGMQNIRTLYSTPVPLRTASLVS